MSNTPPVSFIRLYRELLKAANAFPIYNIREYTKEKIRVNFRAPQPTLSAEQLLQKAKETLALIQRQATIQRLYPSTTLVIESMEENDMSNARAQR